MSVYGDFFLHCPSFKHLHICAELFFFCNNPKAQTQNREAAILQRVGELRALLQYPCKQTSAFIVSERKWDRYSDSNMKRLRLILFCCFIARNQRCSSRSPENHDRPAVQQGMWLLFSLDLIFALPLCQLPHHPLRCSTDRCCVFVVPLCRPDISGGWGVSCFWTRDEGVLYKLTLLFFLIQGTDVIGELCVLMLVQKSKVCIFRSRGWDWHPLTVIIFTLISSQELQVRENSKRVTSTRFSLFSMKLFNSNKQKHNFFRLDVCRCMQVSVHF